MPRHAALACVAAALAGCASRIAVTSAGSGVVLAPRPPDCKVEFYRTKPPERAYDEVATLHFTGTGFASAADAQDGLKELPAARGPSNGVANIGAQLPASQAELDEPADHFLPEAVSLRRLEARGDEEARRGADDPGREERGRRAERGCDDAREQRTDDVAERE